MSYRTTVFNQRNKFPSRVRNSVVTPLSNNLGIHTQYVDENSPYPTGNMTPIDFMKSTQGINTPLNQVPKMQSFHKKSCSPNSVSKSSSNQNINKNIIDQILKTGHHPVQEVKINWNNQPIDQSGKLKKETLPSANISSRYKSNDHYMSSKLTPVIPYLSDLNNYHEYNNNFSMSVNNLTSQ